MRYDVNYRFFPFNSQYLMTWGIDSPAFYVWEVYFLQCLSRNFHEYHLLSIKI